MEFRDAAIQVAKMAGLGMTAASLAAGAVRYRRVRAELAAERRSTSQLKAEQAKDLSRAKAELEVAARKDSLTGVGNRRLLDHVIERMWRQQAAIGGSMAVLLVDIDHFRALNELAGHMRGDDYLRVVAKVLQSAISGERDLLVRYGGDAFLVVLPGAHEPSALRCAGRIHSLLRAEALPHPTSEVSERVTVSIGVAQTRATETALVEPLIEAAEEALAAAKRAGRNRTELATSVRPHVRDPAEPWRIGLLAPFSGVVSMYGEEIHRAAQMAVQAVNEAGGINGRPLELEVADDGSQPASAVAAAAKLVDEAGCVALIGTLLSNSRIAVAEQVAAPRGVPLLSFSFYEGGITDPWFFNFAAVPNQQIEALVPYLMSRFGKRFYFAGNNYEWPRGSIDAAKRILAARGGEVVGEEYLPFAPGEARVTELMGNVASSHAQVFVPYFAGLDQVGVLRAAYTAGLTRSIGIGMGHFDPVLASMLTPEERAGLIVANTYFMGVDTPVNRAVLHRLAEWPGVTGLWPEGNGILTNFGEGAWVCVQAFAEAARVTRDDSPASLVAALEQVVVAAPQGTVTMEPATHHAAVGCFIAESSADGSFAVVARAGSAPARTPERFLVRYRFDDDDSGEDVEVGSSQRDGAVLIVDPAGMVKGANRAAATMFGYESEEMADLDVRALVPPHLRRDFFRYFEAFVASQQNERALAGRPGLAGYRKDGTFFNLAATVAKHSIDGRELIVASLADVQDLVQARQRRHRLITHDPLTGLVNRRLFLQRLASAIGRAPDDGHHLVVVSIDIDGLALVNERFGTGAGDAVLVDVAHRLSERPAGAVVARISDDRFALFAEIPTSAEARAAVVADAAAAANAIVEFAGSTITTTATLGVAGDSDSDSAEDLLAHAEAAMYDAKTTARGGWRFYQPNQQRLAERRHRIDEMLRDPELESQLALHYQPIVSLGLNEVIGAEALLRWQSPTGPVGPAEFIPIAESNGTIMRIGRWVIEQGLQALAGFHDDFGSHTPLLSINISPLQLPQAAKMFGDLLDDLGLDASEVLVEVTETGLDSLDEGANADLAAIKAVGLGVAIDDFGTGTSGLSVVSRMNIDTLKIDRSFVDGAFNLPRRRKLLGAIVSMAHALGLSVIAEGVEDPRDLEFLKTVGCDAAQGYLLAKPMPLADLQQLWRESTSGVHQQA
ncbi:MAG: diguanylate cyclase [Actinobacteria bacterium]|nr:diguanylate cyclase [Actinomycetota bacterium]